MNEQVTAESAFANPWVQLIIGVICMACVANLQYGWTLFVNPIDAKYHWGRASIQVAFSLFVLLETWLIPVEGYMVDRFGPRWVVITGGILVAIAWMTELCRKFIADAVFRRGRRRHWYRLRLRHLRRQCAQVVSRAPRACCRHHRLRIWGRSGDHNRTDQKHDRDFRIRACVPDLRSDPGRHRLRVGMAAVGSAAQPRVGDGQAQSDSARLYARRGLSRVRCSTSCTSCSC